MIKMNKKYILVSSCPNLDMILITHVWAKKDTFKRTFLVKIFVYLRMKSSKTEGLTRVGQNNNFSFRTQHEAKSMDSLNMCLCL